MKIVSSDRCRGLVGDFLANTWFSCVGSQFDETRLGGVKVVRAASWDDGAKYMMSKSTVVALTAAQQLMYEEVFGYLAGVDPSGHGAAFDDWVDSWFESLDDMESRIAGDGHVPGEYLEVCWKVTRSIISLSIVLAQFSDVVVQNLLYERLGEVLLAGHCVCGWRGKLDTGYVVIY